MVRKLLMSSVWAPVIRTQGQNNHTGCYPHFEICANCSDGRLLLVVHRVSVSIRPKVNISEGYFQRTLQPSNCRVTLWCLLASANFTSLDLYSFSCNVLNLLEHLIFFFLKLLFFCSNFLFWYTYTHLKQVILGLLTLTSTVAALGGIRGIGNVIIIVLWCYGFHSDSAQEGA